MYFTKVDSRDAKEDIRASENWQFQNEISSSTKEGSLCFIRCEYGVAASVRPVPPLGGAVNPELSV